MNTFAHEDFKEDNDVCNNGDINKLSEYFAPFAQAVQGESTSHVTFDLENELYKSMETQVYLSYQRVYMNDGQRRAGAPSLLDYSTALQNYYTKRKTSTQSWVLSSMERWLARELRVIFENIRHIFHGVAFADNPQGLLTYRDVVQLDAIAQVLSELPGITAIEDANPADAIIKFNNIVAREWNFSQNVLNLPEGLVSQIKNSMFTKFREEVLSDVAPFRLNSSKAFNYTPVILISGITSAPDNSAEALRRGHFFSRTDQIIAINNYNTHTFTNSDNLEVMGSTPLALTNFSLGSRLVFAADNRRSRLMPDATAVPSASAAALANTANRGSRLIFAADNRRSRIIIEPVAPMEIANSAGLENTANGPMRPGGHRRR